MFWSMDNEKASMTEPRREEVVWLPRQQCKEGWLESDCSDPQGGSHTCFPFNFFLCVLPLLLPSQVQLFEHFQAPWGWLRKYGCNSRVVFSFPTILGRSCYEFEKLVGFFFFSVEDKISIRTVGLSYLTVTQCGWMFMLIWHEQEEWEWWAVNETFLNYT